METFFWDTVYVGRHCDHVNVCGLKGLIVDQTIEKVSFCAPDNNSEPWQIKHYPFHVGWHCHCVNVCGLKGLIVDQTIEKVSFCAPDRNSEPWQIAPWCRHSPHRTTLSLCECVLSQGSNCGPDHREGVILCSWSQLWTWLRLHLQRRHVTSMDLSLLLCSQGDGHCYLLDTSTFLIVQLTQP